MQMLIFSLEPCTDTFILVLMLYFIMYVMYVFVLFNIYKCALCWLDIYNKYA